METLKIKNENTKETVNKVNSFRLQNKNNWFQVEITNNIYVHKIKAFNTWLQICRTYKDEKLLHNSPSGMDITPAQFKKHIEDILTQ